MNKIHHILENPREDNGKIFFQAIQFMAIHFAVVGPVEADPEYQLIVDSNNMAVQIDNETSKLHTHLHMNDLLQVYTYMYGW